MLSVVAVAGFALAVYAAWLFHDMPDAADLVNYRPPTSTRVYAWDGTLIGEFSKERRIFVPYDQIPPRLVEAFLAAEDRNFFQHGGIDMTGLGRAMTKDVFNALRGKRLEGGSTITQQVAKNVLLGNEHSVGRKLKEAILARRLEQTLDKPRILELYLNQIWLGYRSYGVGAAAYNYFGKSLNELSLSEMAYLGSLPKGPDNYQPVRNKRAAIARRNWVLGQMAESGWITRAEADQASKDDLVVQAAPSRAKYQDADYFVEEVRERALSTVGEKLTEGGYYMRTTLDPRLQTMARSSLMQGLENYDHRHGWRGPFATTNLAEGWEKAALTHVAPAERRDWAAAAIVSESPVRVKLATGGEGDLEPADVAWARVGKGLHRGDLVWVEPSAPGRYHLRQIPQVNGALVAMDPYTGRVLAMVGGYSFSLSNFNRATQAMRQPGSSFKPFVYATALQNGYTPARIVMDAPITLQGNRPGETWSPQNYEGDFLGPLPMRRGLELSLNAMTVRIAQSVGMKKIADNAIKAGIVDHMDPVLAMALGAGETTPFRLTAAYSAFVNGGYKVQPHLIELVQDQQGKTIFDADPRACAPCNADYAGEDAPKLDPPAQQPLFDPITAYQINSMLQGVVQRGTASAARVIGRPLGGKTGTTSEFRSAWFVGFSPDMVVGVFVGFDDNRSLGNKETGAVDAVPIFIDFMQQALKDQPVHDFKAPANARFAYVGGVREAFQPGTEPRQDVPLAPVDAAIPLPDQEEAPPPGAPAPPGRPPGAPALAPPPRPADDLKGLY
ncbi:MAG TPA: penicillin-binding protein 1A [Caulobacteraceae bacterium]|nr:penicillin-binding protein 1A [Caulobacteraceae bacterium]